MTRCWRPAPNLKSSSLRTLANIDASALAWSATGPDEVVARSDPTPATAASDLAKTASAAVK
jgi:hypothetical protein